MEAMKEYVAHLDNKKRITLRGAAYQYYNVKEYGNGCIILEPRELTVPESISASTLADMDRAVSNFKRGDVSPAIDLSELNMSSWSMKNRLAAFFLHEITKIGDKKYRQMGKEICRHFLVRVI